MSVVVAVQKADRLVLAADSLTSFGEQDRIPPANSKVAKIYPLGDSILGAAGWAVYDDILRHYFDSHPVPSLTNERQIFSFFIEFWKALHNGYPFVNDQASSKDTPFGDLDSTFLFGTSGGIFKVGSDMGVTRFDQYYAIGSGAEYALGAIHAQYESENNPETIARRAVEAAIAFNVYCGGDVDVHTIDMAQN